MNEIVQFSNETEWMQEVVACYDQAVYAQWKFAVVLRDGIDQFGWGDKKKDELYEKIATQLTLQPSSLKKTYNIVKSESAQIALALGLSFQHARVAYSFAYEVSHTEAMLYQAAEWQWEPEKLRYEILSYKLNKGSKPLFRESPIVATKNDVPPIIAADIADVRSLHELLSAVNRQKDLTTVGAQTLPVNMTPKENYALAVYGHVANDQLNWTRGDHYNRVVDDLKARARRENWAPAKLQAEIAGELWKMATNSHTSTETILLNAATAAAFPNERWQTITIGYAHHELLRNSEVAGEWLARAEANKWTPEQLDAQMHPHRSNDDIIINIIKGVQGIQLDEQAITLTSAHGKLIITQWHIE